MADLAVVVVCPICQKEWPVATNAPPHKLKEAFDANAAHALAEHPEAVAAARLTQRQQRDREVGRRRGVIDD